MQPPPNRKNESYRLFAGPETFRGLPCIWHMAILGLFYLRVLLFKSAVWALSGLLAFASMTFDYPAVAGNGASVISIAPLVIIQTR
jgi:hypothetical protein